MDQPRAGAAFVQAGARGCVAIAASALLLGLSTCSLAYPLDGYAGAPRDGGPASAGDGGDAGAATLDAAALATVGMVRCGPDTCKTPDEVCCGEPGSFGCTTASKCTHTLIACDDGADCVTGAVCCAFRDAGAVTVVRCAATSACPLQSGAATVFCNPVDPSACATGGSCQVASEAQLPRTSTYDECR